MTDPDFLATCGILPDPIWLIELNNCTGEQRRYIEDLLRLNILLGGGLQVTLGATATGIPPGWREGMI